MSISSTSDKQYIFIVSSPRSGSTWLQLMIGAHPNVCTSIEVTIYDRYVGPLLKAWQSEVAQPNRPGLCDQWTEAEFTDFLRDFVQRTYRPIWATNPQATHLLDKRPANAEYIEAIDQLLPGSRFIHIIRDGRDVAASMLAAAKDLWFLTDTVEKAANKWQEKVTQSRQGQVLGERYLEVRYEDLVTDGVATMAKVFDFCGLTISHAAIETIVTDHAFEKLQESRKAATEGFQMPKKFYRKGQVGGWRDELNAEQLAAFHRIAGDLLQTLGYDPLEEAT